ncbi:MAG TPA: GNAT family N-acetyltransferase [Pseudoneobacillus sp.]|nr:GNAT family N-acetyltransferase [Pseudoneobacillus sp.]
MEFIKTNTQFISIEMEIMNSHPDYLLLSDGKNQLSYEDLLEEHLEEEELDKERYLIKEEDNYVGIIDYIMENPNDKKPWLGLLIIRKEFTNMSLAKKAYGIYEMTMKNRGIQEVYLGCYKDNHNGLKFWKKNGFSILKEINYNEKPFYVLEKKIS